MSLTLLFGKFGTSKNYVLFGLSICSYNFVLVNNMTFRNSDQECRVNIHILTSQFRNLVCVKEDINFQFVLSTIVRGLAGKSRNYLPLRALLMLTHNEIAQLQKAL